MRFTTLPPTPQSPHLFTVDVEDYFQVVAFEGLVDRAAWDGYPSRVEANTDRLLELLARHGAKGTFFTLGWIAEKHPGIVRRIAAAGHEVASHGYWHRRLTTLTQDAFRTDIRDSKARLEDLSGQPCLGFRAPSFSIIPGGEWAFDLLLEEGYRYDSSLFPIRRPDYGYPLSPETPYLIERPGGTLLELPLTTTRLLGLRLPAAGGGYLRQFPFALFRRAFRQWGERGISAMFYIHPWEYDDAQPRLPCGRLTAFRHYHNLDLVWSRMDQLLEEFSFTSVAERFAEVLNSQAAPSSQAAR
jgi:polysaccharide deacetylase family protein (PEP-CTERM system associated)